MKSLEGIYFMIGYIYKTTDRTNGKIYVGKKHSETFLGESYLGSGKILKNCIKVHGRQHFTVEMLDSADTLEELNQKERYYIKKYNSRDRSVGYNISEGGDGVIGVQAWNKGQTVSTNPKLAKSQQAKDNISKVLREKWKTEKKSQKSGFKCGKRTAEQNKENSSRQLGKRWMYLSDGENIIKRSCVLSENINKYLSLGYQFGRYFYSQKAWNKGQTKETNENLRKQSEKRKKSFHDGKSIGCYGLSGEANHNSTLKLAKDIADEQFYSYWYENGKYATMKHYNIGPHTYKHCCELLNIIETSEHKSYIRSKSRKKINK